jgi:hypothetical protein
MDDARAACAGVVAELQELSSRAGLGSGDLAVWIGDGARATLGARLSALRGCPTFHLGGAAAAGVTALASPTPERLERSAGRGRRLAPGRLPRAAPFRGPRRAGPGRRGAGAGRPGHAAWDSSTVRATADCRSSALASCRVLVSAGFGYHPDLVPEALAALRRDPALTEGLIGDGPATTARLAFVRL